MLFNSWHFLAFFLLVLSVACWLPRYRIAWKIFIIAASCYFYGQWSWKYLSLIVITASIDYSIAHFIPRSKYPGRLLALSVFANLSVLAFFKYINFIINSANGLNAFIGADFHLTPLDIILPVGISFYTFQNMSYTIDVYRGTLKPRTSILDYAVFTTFFPQLLAGPIVRASEFFAQLEKPNAIDFKKLQYALVLIALGYVKKMVLADNLALSVDEVFNAPSNATPWQALLSVYAFAFQIYFDFSGYTDIAIGLALLLGFEYPKNFNYPYIAASFQDFWRRWHMTLSRWLRDYLYISLGGNRYSPTRTMANLMTTMLLGGLWHGASWNFVIWGGLHGLYLAIERTLLSKLRWWSSESLPARALRGVIVFHAVCFAWIFFRANDLTISIQIIKAITMIFVAPHGLMAVLNMAAFIASLVALHFAMEHWNIKQRLTETNSLGFAGFITAVILILIWFTPAKSAPFIYFQF